MKFLKVYAKTLKNNIQGKTLLLSFVIALLYIILSVYAVNRTIIMSTLFGNLPEEYKSLLLRSLLIDSWAMFSPIEGILLLSIALLMGLNITLMGKTVTKLRGENGLRVSFGGSSMVAVMSAGCPGCGISLLSLAGISTPLLPFQGVPLQLVSVFMLSGSLFYLLSKLKQPVACNVPLVVKQ